MPGGIALEDQAMRDAHLCCQNVCGGKPSEGPQQLLQLPYPDKEQLGANGLLGCVVLLLLERPHFATVAPSGLLLAGWQFAPCFTV